MKIFTLTNKKRGGLLTIQTSFDSITNFLDEIKYCNKYFIRQGAIKVNKFGFIATYKEINFQKVAEKTKIENNFNDLLLY